MKYRRVIWVIGEMVLFKGLQLRFETVTVVLFFNNTASESQISFFQLVNIKVGMITGLIDV